MKLPPVPDNLLAALFVDYTCFGKKHTVHFHIPSVATQAGAITSVRNVLTAALPMLSTGWQTVGARWRDAGSPVTVPATFATMTGSNATAVLAEHYSMSVTFLGRANTGRRARMVLFGCAAGFAQDFRWTRADYAVVASIIDALRAEAANIRCKDGAAIVWYDFADVANNAYWQRKYRS